MADLILPLKREYFEQIRDGIKAEEYRLCSPYWVRRLEGRHYSSVILTLGYPRRDDTSRRIVRPWRIPTIKTIVHPHFGLEPVEVYAIEVGPE